MTDKDAEQIAKDVFKHNLKASEQTRNLFHTMPQEEAEDLIIEEFNRLMELIEDEQKAEDAAMLVQRLAQGLQSERLADVVMKEAQENPLLVVEGGE